MDEISGVHSEVRPAGLPSDAQARIDQAFILRDDTRNRFGGRSDPESEGSKKFSRVQTIVRTLGMQAQEGIRMKHLDLPQEKFVDSTVQYGQWMDLGVLKAREGVEVREMQGRLHMTNDQMIPVLEGYFAEMIVEGHGKSAVAAVSEIGRLREKNISDTDMAEKYIPFINKERRNMQEKEPPGQEFDKNMLDVGFQWKDIGAGKYEPIPEA